MGGSDHVAFCLENGTLVGKFGTKKDEDKLTRNLIDAPSSVVSLASWRNSMAFGSIGASCFFEGTHEPMSLGPPVAVGLTRSYDIEYSILESNYWSEQ